jgi:hypothetical protein
LLKILENGSGAFGTSGIAEIAKGSIACAEQEGR